MSTLGSSLGDFTARDIDGQDVDLSSYDGQVVLVVNTASQCGFTPQYAGLEQLFEDHRADGFVVLGFPCDQFGNQEPGSEHEIAPFCETSYGVTFPMFAKVEVNGDGEHPLYAWLQGREGRPRGADIDWNFTKFLIDRDGNVLDRFGPTTTPEEITPRGREGVGGGVPAYREVRCSSPASAAHSAAPDDAGPVLQLGGHDLGLDADQVHELVGVLADPAADHEQVGREQLLQRPVVDREPLRPLRVGQPLQLLDRAGGAVLGVVPVDLEVAELGVRHQHAVVDDRRPAGSATYDGVLVPNSEFGPRSTGTTRRTAPPRSRTWRV